MNIFAFLMAVAFTLHLLTGVYALWMNPRERLNRMFSLSCLCFAIWALGVAFECGAHDKESVWFWWRLGALGWAAFPAVYLHMFLLFTRKGRDTTGSRWLLLIYAPAVLFLVLAFVPGTIASDYVSGRFGWYQLSATGSPWFWGYVAYYTSFVTASMIVVNRWASRERTRRSRELAFVITVAVLTAVSLGTITDIILPLWRPGYLPRLAPIVAIIWSTGMWYAIGKHRFLTLTPEVFASAVVPNMRDMVFLMDAAGNIVSVNRAVEKIGNFQDGELAGRPAASLLSDAKGEVFGRQQAGNLNIDTMFLTKAGERIPVNLSVFGLRDEYGDRMGMAWVLRDMRDTVRLQDRLRQQEKMSAIGQLAGGVAHDFNNILTSVIGYADLILDRLTPADPNWKQVNEIRKSGLRASALTRQLLAFSRKQELKSEILDLHAIIRGMEITLRQALTGNIELQIELGPAPAWIRANHDQIEKVILNLAVNSRDAMPRGGIIRIGTANVCLDDEYAKWHTNNRAGAYVCLSIIDDGSGMTPAVQARIFEPFFTTKTKGTGTGLGLSTVYGIVNQHRGNIWVYSEPGKGTTVKVYLPQVTEAGELCPGVPDARPRTGTETILLVEDEMSLLETVRETLVGCGYRIIATNDPDKVLALAADHDGPIHLLLTDLTMPGMSGRELAEIVQSRRPGMRTLYMSGYADDTGILNGTSVSNHSFLEKPFTAAVLTDKVRQVLDMPVLARAFPGLPPDSGIPGTAGEAGQALSPTTPKAGEAGQALSPTTPEASEAGQALFPTTPEASEAGQALSPTTPGSG